MPGKKLINLISLEDRVSLSIQDDIGAICLG